MTSIDYSQKIPNNVELSSDKRLQRALERWQPDYIDWWRSAGPTDFNEREVYLRTAVSVDRDGWANFGYVPMPDYRWGIFLTEREADRRVGFGDHEGEQAWQEVPGEYRNWLRRLIVTQADTEPASVEQQRLLGHTAPSLYDLRNLFQVNVEEGRHLWAMVYLLHSYFGRDGREEADELLERRSGNPDHPRILGTFNEPCTDWLSFFCFTMFTDRDGKFQLLALAESGFDPLARSCRFMLTEEAHHMFVGQTGVARVIQRTCELMNENPGKDVRELGGIPLDLIQRYVNFWASSSVDLFGAEVSSNASNFFRSGLKGRAWEERYTDHQALEDAYTFERYQDGAFTTEEVPLRNAMNEVLRDEYIKDNEKGVEYWNRVCEKAGVDFRFRLPHRRFNRTIGEYGEARFDVDGNPLDEGVWERDADGWLPSEADRDFVRSLMQPVTEPGRMAGWIAPPAKGIDGKTTDFEYVLP
ncbi:MAG: benzoyl-CoA 2,3-epoxidase subunit BoxB [Planctomycetota bacterium]|jgi:benzoyl-CoA 2,3-dioxygenase component B|nr:benzoyl-CoA 2,3-epoxidase subunit BoxB [Planctomycetota bacterium]MDP6762158.1 benzoyl-CoA 2,3-epoxidase subunit BoxB [Planctomycetota bacterium]MDP6988582.1 benzoyl-CoA 2,3-epoxidase subunit BoxB [Planctomycetota bacterium]